MANIREYTGKRGKRFQVQVRIAGFPPRNGTFPNRRMAERWAKTVEAEMIEGRHSRSAGAYRHTVAEAIDRYISEEVPKKRDRRESRLLWWREKIGHFKLVDVTGPVLAEYRAKLKTEPFIVATPGSKNSTLAAGEKPNEFKRANGTVNRHLAYLSHVFAIARREWHWMGHDPFDGVSKLPESRGRVRFLTDEERERLLAETAKDRQLHVLVVLALSTAARAGELLSLRWQDIEIESDAARVLLGKTKNGEPRSVWLHGKALRLLKEHKAGQCAESERVFVSEDAERYYYRNPFEQACERAGVVNFRFHDLRHSAATYLSRLGATEQQLKAIGGWKSSVVSRYVHLAAEDARGVLERMNNRILGAQDK
jgi:integrase